MKLMDEKIAQIGQQLKEKYEASPDLQTKFKSVDDYLENEVVRIHLLVIYDQDSSLQKEFRGAHRFVSYMLAHRKNLVQIIGRKTIS